MNTATMNTSLQGRIHSIESMGALDGPGVRFIIFFQGCPLRCIFCHNPDTWATSGETLMSVEQLVDKALRCRPYFGEEGGVTLSGGEPLAQAPFALALIEALHQQELHVAVDTSGGIDTPEALAVLDAADLILLDIKSPTPERYQEVTGLPMDAHKHVVAHLAQTQKPIWIRQVIAQGLNDSPAERDATQAYIAPLNVQRFDYLPYHELGLHKYTALGIPYRGASLKPPTQLPKPPSF